MSDRRDMVTLASVGAVSFTIELPGGRWVVYDFSRVQSTKIVDGILVVTLK
jgi:hypothetical protein